MAHSQNTLTHTQYCDDTKGKTTLAGSWGQGWTAQNGRILGPGMDGSEWQGPGILGPGMDGSEWQGPGTRDGRLRMAGSWDQGWMAQNATCQLLWHIHPCHTIRGCQPEIRSFLNYLAEKLKHSWAPQMCSFMALLKFILFPKRYCPAILTSGKMTEQ